MGRVKGCVPPSWSGRGAGKKQFWVLESHDSEKDPRIAEPVHRPASAQLVGLLKTPKRERTVLEELEGEPVSAARKNLR